MISDEIAKEISTWISKETFKFIQMWQLHLFSTRPRINCTAEIRHPACSIQTGARDRSKLSNNNTAFWSFSHGYIFDISFNILPSCHVTMTKNFCRHDWHICASGREWKQATSPVSDSKRPTGILQIFCMYDIRI